MNRVFKTQAFVWTALAVLSLILYLTSKSLPQLTVFPSGWVLSPADAMNNFMTVFVAIFGPAFKWVGWLLEWPVRWAQSFLQFLPWSVTTAVFVFLGLIGSGWRLALFAGLAMLYMAVIGYWNESMNSLAIVLISVPMAVTTGFLFGVLGFYSTRARRFIMPLLDLLQTIPAFAYLLPILILFGFGTTVGLVASILYAFPPMVRNTILGLRAVPEEIVEAGMMSGATPAQLFWKVWMPAAQKQLLLGVNQTTMASLSMVIIASIIGGTNDIGWEVLSTMRKAQFGESLLAGFVIALIAMALDRITFAFATKPKEIERTGPNLWLIGALVIAVLMALSTLAPFLRDWPEALIWNPAGAMNDALEWVVVNGREWIEGIKNAAFFFVMLPIKIGLSDAVSPFTWGFAMTPALTAGYAGLIGFGVLWAVLRKRLTLAALILLWGVVSYIGLTQMPWIALFAIIVYGAYVGVVDQL